MSALVAKATRAKLNRYGSARKGRCPASSGHIGRYLQSTQS